MPDRVKRLQTESSGPRRTGTRGGRRGASLIEMALLLPLLLSLVFGSLTGSLILGRLLGVLQLMRYAGSMYARGTNFTVNGGKNKDLLLMGAGGLGITTSGGNGVIYMSKVVKDIKTGNLVVADTVSIGNTSLGISKGVNIPASFNAISSNEQVFVVEVYYNMATVGGWKNVFPGLATIYRRAYF